MQQRRRRKIAQEPACVLFALGRLYEDGVDGALADNVRARECYEQVLLMGDTLAHQHALARLAGLEAHDIASTSSDHAAPPASVRNHAAPHAFASSRTRKI